MQRGQSGRFAPAGSGATPFLPLPQRGQGGLGREGGRYPVSLGATAQSLLARPRFSATVIAPGRSATYLRTDDGEIFWLAPAGGVRHPRAILVNTSMFSIRRDAPAAVINGDLFIGGHCIYSVDGGTVWSPPALDWRFRGSTLQIATRLRAAARLASALPNSTPLLVLVSTLILDGKPPQNLTATDAFTSRAWPQLVMATSAFAAGDTAFIERLISSLVGLGPGLTPSGDDIIGGLLFALACLSSPSIGGRGAVRGAGWAALLAGRTHEISIAIIRDLASGEGPEPLHDLARELLDTRSTGPVAATVQRVAAIGHQSGRDLLAGFFVGLFAFPQEQCHAR
ncbi:MAG: oxamate carbamoyltransferase subunit AllH family protein [Dehalococcoidia bacterium]